MGDGKGQGGPAEGGQAPFHVWQRAVREGFAPVATTGSLRVLRKP